MVIMTEVVDILYKITYYQIYNEQPMLVYVPTVYLPAPVAQPPAPVVYPHAPVAQPPTYHSHMASLVSHPEVQHRPVTRKTQAHSVNRYALATNQPRPAPMTTSASVVAAAPVVAATPTEFVLLWSSEGGGFWEDVLKREKVN